MKFLKFDRVFTFILVPVIIAILACFTISAFFIFQEPGDDMTLANKNGNAYYMVTTDYSDIGVKAKTQLRVQVTSNLTDYNVGDIVLFKAADGTYQLDEVTAISATQLSLKSSGAVASADIVGKKNWSSAFLGWISYHFGVTGLVFWIIFGVLIAIILYQIIVILVINSVEEEEPEQPANQLMPIAAPIAPAAPANITIINDFGALGQFMKTYEVNPENTSELIVKEKILQEERDKAFEELNKMESELEDRVKEAIEARLKAEMTVEELQALKEREKNSTTEVFGINKITAEVLQESALRMREDVTEYRVPLGTTYGFTFEDVKAYANGKHGVTMKEGVGRKPTAFKNGNKSFLLAYNLGEQIKVTFKCGPNYADFLKALYPEIVNSKFPYGIIWFTIEHAEKIPFEVLRQLIDISHEISARNF